jgi:hypothetical protein
MKMNPRPIAVHGSSSVRELRSALSTFESHQKTFDRGSCNTALSRSGSIESPRVMNYLTKPSEEEIQMIHPSKVYASKSSIPKVSAKVAAIAALASNQDNQK